MAVGSAAERVNADNDINNVRKDENFGIIDIDFVFSCKINI